MSRYLVFLFIALALAVVICPKVVSSGEIGIYLLADEKMNAGDALKLKLDDIPLQEKPLLTMDDFVCYSWKDHSFKLTPEGIRKLPKYSRTENPGGREPAHAGMLLLGMPFVLVVNGERVYMGAFSTHVSSHRHPIPTIFTDLYMLPMQGNRFHVEWPGAIPGQPWYRPDPPALKEAFKGAGKLDACGDATSKTETSKTPGSGSGFGVYLLANEKMNARDAIKLKLGDIPLQKKPLLTIDDFTCYNWEDHSFELTREAVKKLPKPQVSGVPFVVMAKGQRIYLGTFWTHLSSLSFDNPVICTDSFMLPMQGNRFIIDRAYPGVTQDTPKEDPRDSPAIKSAFEAAGKLDTCGDSARQPNAETSGPPVAGSEFGIYLLRDERITAVDALKLKLDDIVLQDKPLFTMLDVVEYHWPDHGIALWGKSMSKLPLVYKPGAPIQPLPYGIPFVVVADGKRVYLGGFFPPEPPRLESVSFPNPAIVLVHPLARSSSILGIRPVYPRSTPMPKDDPRDSWLIKAVFEAAGKLHIDTPTPCPEEGDPK